MAFLIAGPLLALLLAGVMYQRAGMARNRRQYAAPGVMVPAGGHRLHVDCRGQGMPAVVLESGIGASSLNWALVAPAVATFTGVCTYDRAGLGWSDPPSSPRTFDAIVDDLSVMLDKGVAAGPRVLVGHSFGSFVVSALAMRRPDRVAGVVLVDPALEWLTASAEHQRLLRGGRLLSRLGALLAHVGVVRAALALLTGGAPGAPRQFVKIFGATAAGTLGRIVGEVRKFPPELHPVVQAHWCNPKCFRALGEYLLTLERDAPLMADVAVPADIPVVVISSAEQPPLQLEAHRQLAARSRDGRHLVATRGGHWVQLDEPELVVSAIRTIVDSCRHGSGLEAQGSETRPI